MEPAALAGQPDRAAVLLKGGSRPRAMVWHRENDLGLIEIYTQNSEQGLPTKSPDYPVAPPLVTFSLPSVPIALPSYGSRWKIIEIRLLIDVNQIFKEADDS